MMSATIVILILLSAFLHASWNAFAKKGLDTTLSIAAFHTVAAIIAVPIIFRVPLPNSESLPYLIASVVIHCAYIGLLGKAYRTGDLSQVYPIARGTAPVLVTIISFLLLRETLPFLTLFGILITCSGIMLLSFNNSISRYQDHRPLVLSLSAGFMIAAYTIMDGLGVRHSVNPMSYISWLFILTGVTFSLILTFLRRKNLKETLQYFIEYRLVILVGGIATATAYGIVIYAMRNNSMAMVSTLRETSVLIGIVIGVVALKESFGKIRISAAILVIGGVFMMNVIN